MNTLSKTAIKLLKWLSKNDQWQTKSEIAKKYKDFDDRAFKAIVNEKYVGIRLSSDTSQWAQYRISDSGKAYLEGAKHARQANVREWLSLGLSVVAIIISIVALLMQQGIL